MSTPEISSFVYGQSHDRPPASWFLLHVRSRQEKALSQDLERARIDHYLPLNKVVRYYGRRKVHVSEPLFSGYMFLKGRREDAFAADRTRRVASILAVADQERLENELLRLKNALDQTGYLSAVPLLEPGIRVEVTSGPFKGIVGTVASMAERHRLVLEVSALGQGAVLELDGSLVRPIEEAAGSPR